MERVTVISPLESGPTPAADDAYFADATTWSRDANASLRTSRTIAWRVAAAAVLVAILQAIALALLVPLKTVVPYTITVDRQTGAAQLARGIDLGAANGLQNATDALTQSTVAQYVLARETIDAADIAANYRKVGLWSADTARSDYLRSMDRSNPTSILIGADSATQVITTVKSVSLTSPTTALVRFTTDRRQGDGPITRNEWASVLQFAFTGGPLSVEDRLINPLGFQVVRYRRDAEALTPQIIVPSVLPKPAPPEPVR